MVQRFLWFWSFDIARSYASWRTFSWMKRLRLENKQREREGEARDSDKSWTNELGLLNQEEAGGGVGEDHILSISIAESCHGWVRFTWFRSVLAALMLVSLGCRKESLAQLHDEIAMSKRKRFCHAWQKLFKTT